MSEGAGVPRYAAWLGYEKRIHESGHDLFEIDHGETFDAGYDAGLAEGFRQAREAVEETE